jgi:hypothetical protein
VLLALCGCSATGLAVTAPDPAASAPASAPTPEPTAAPVVAENALDLLATLPIKGKAPKTGYDREVSFGAAWLDVDHNGCDTRNDVLATDATGETYDGSCTVLTGTVYDPYTDTTITFVRGADTSSLAQVDHRVALLNAWETGAQNISQEQREALANDPDNLIVVDGKTNSQKGAGDAATWLPPNKAYRCTYVAAQIQVKAKYGLWVTQAEHDVMSTLLNACNGPVTLVPSTPAATTPATAAPAAPTVDPAPAVDTIHPGSICSDQGLTGVSDAGKTYTCGSKGADANGRFHWNS